jgi:hypothetical protein
MKYHNRYYVYAPIRVEFRWLNLFPYIYRSSDAYMINLL